MKNQTTSSESDNVALLIRHKVKADQISRYEAWLARIVSLSAKQEGHQGVNVLRPPSGQSDYTIVIHWASLSAAEKWTSSKDRKELIAEIADAFEAEDRPEIHPGIEFWFTPPAPGQKRPAPWKQWLVTTSVI